VLSGVGIDFMLLFSSEKCGVRSSSGKMNLLTSKRFAMTGITNLMIKVLASAINLLMTLLKVVNMLLRIIRNGFELPSRLNVITS
jgi:hypothetical protein